MSGSQSGSDKKNGLKAAVRKAMIIDKMFATGTASNPDGPPGGCCLLPRHVFVFCVCMYVWSGHFHSVLIYFMN